MCPPQCSLVPSMISQVRLPFTTPFRTRGIRRIRSGRVTHSRSERASWTAGQRPEQTELGESTRKQPSSALEVRREANEATLTQENLLNLVRTAVPVAPEPLGPCLQPPNSACRSSPWAGVAKSSAPCPAPSWGYSLSLPQLHVARVGSLSLMRRPRTPGPHVQAPAGSCYTGSERRPPLRSSGAVIQTFSPKG